jgi:hypothetical protein
LIQRNLPVDLSTSWVSQPLVGRVYETPSVPDAWHECRSGTQIAESGAVAVLTVSSGSTDGLTQGYA